MRFTILTWIYELFRQPSPFFSTFSSVVEKKGRRKMVFVRFVGDSLRALALALAPAREGVPRRFGSTIRQLAGRRRPSRSLCFPAQKIGHGHGHVERLTASECAYYHPCQRCGNRHRTTSTWVFLSTPLKL